MQRCARCGAVSPDTARTCQRCGASFQRQGPVQRSSDVRSTQTAPGTVPSKKKQRSFLVGLLALLGIRYDPQKGSWGCALVPTISVALVAVIITGVIVGPVLKLIPPFSPGLTVIGNIAPGASVIVHGANFPPGSHINLTLDGTSVALVPTSHRSTFQSLYDLSLSVAHANPLQQAEQPSASTGNIIVSNDGTFDAQVSIPKSWQPNSQHVIQAQAIGQDGRAQAQVQQIVTMPGSGGNQGVSSSQGQSSSGSSSPTTSSRPFHFSFSGAVTGTLVVGTVKHCGPATTPNGDIYEVTLDGTVNGASYNLAVEVGYVLSNFPGYTGPGTYGVGSGADPTGMETGTLDSTSPPSNIWLIQSGTIIVNSDVHSGSISATLRDSNDGSRVQVTGNWICG